MAGSVVDPITGEGSRLLPCHLFRPRPKYKRPVDIADTPSMRFSIITPSFRSLKWLKLCSASIADQSVPLEHIIQDSCSEDGTGEWLGRNSSAKFFIEKDRGMYDGVNRGLKKA